MLSGKNKNILIVLVVLALLLLVAPFTGSYVMLLLTRVLIFSILAMSVELLLGFTGLPSLGQAAYLGVGAYATAIFATRFEFGLGCDFGLVIVAGVLIGAATAAVFGLFALRATDNFFLIITLALGMVVWGLAYRWNSVTGGDNGINVFARPVCGIDLAEDLNYFYFSFFFFFITLAGLYLLVNSPFGRTLVGIRESNARMRMLGYNTWLHKYVAFIISGGMAGLAGVLWVTLNGIIAPDDVLLGTSVDALLVVVLGGPGTLVGGVMGAAVVIFIREYLSTQVTWWQYLLGGAYVLTILFLPGGLMGIPARYRRWRSAQNPSGELATTDSAPADSGS